jgi:hypothetical protein
VEAGLTSILRNKHHLVQASPSQRPGAFGGWRPRIVKDNITTYELFSNTPIPDRETAWI